MSRRGLQGFNEAEAWRMVCDTWPAADLSVTRNLTPVLHWTAVLKDPSLGTATASGYSRYEMLRILIVEMDKEQRIQAEIAERERPVPSRRADETYEQKQQRLRREEEDRL